MVKKALLIFISGSIWFFVGVLLLSKGINLIVFSLGEEAPVHFSLVQFFTPYLGLMRSVLLLVALGLLLGYIKGRYVLIKTVKRVVARIISLEEPIAFARVYSPYYLLLLLCMVGLGVSFRFFPVATDVRGTVDLAIGAALMNGALLYFRFALATRKQ